MKRQTFQIIEKFLQIPIVSHLDMSGGQMAKSMVLKLNNGQQVFCKSYGENTDKHFKEASGLKEIKCYEVIKVPKVLHATESFLLLEFIGPGKKSPDFFQIFGGQLAKLHRISQKEFYGFYEDNYIGNLPQSNTPPFPTTGQDRGRELASYFLEYRLRPQVHQARARGLVTSDLHDLLAQLELSLDHILRDYDEGPCLIHGDLWNGNFLVTEQGHPCLIDPAVSFSPREAELSMTHLFGGFPPGFYESYQEEYPLSPGYEKRIKLFQIYHLLNHLNHFGRGYHQLLKATLQSLLQGLRD